MLYPVCLWTGVGWNSESSGAALWHCFLWYTIPVLDDVAHLQYRAILFKNHTRGKTIYKQLSVKIDIHIKIKENSDDIYTLQR